MFDDVLSKAKEYLDLNYDLELVEIVESSGATPRAKGAFMFVDKNSESFGTIGGGAIEYQATLYAKELLDKKENGIKEYDLSQKQAENIGMVCGGNNVCKFTYLTNNKESFDIIDKLIELNKNKTTVYIFGGGHVSREVAKILKYTSFEYIVWDDREDFANSERFSDAKKVICKPYENILNEVNIDNNDFVIVLTRGHSYDYIVLEQILKSNPYYIGCIGSRAKNKVIKDNLLSNGYTENEVNKICAPIGLSIGADTPEEIAISIVGELILFRAKMENRRKIISGGSLISNY